MFQLSLKWQMAEGLIADNLDSGLVGGKGL